MPTLPPYLIEPIRQRFSALLPEREIHHPLGCHRSRTPERVVFEKRVQVLVFGCAYEERIADRTCSATTLQGPTRRVDRTGGDEYLAGVGPQSLRDRFVGLELPDVAVYCCITKKKAPCGGEKAGRSPVDRGKRGTERSTAVDAKGTPLGNPPGQPPWAPSPLRQIATTRRC